MDTGSGWTPLMRVSAVSGDQRVASLLIEGGADVNVRDKDGKTPLMVGCAVGRAGSLGGGSLSTGGFRPPVPPHQPLPAGRTVSAPCFCRLFYSCFYRNCPSRPQGHGGVQTDLRTRGGRCHLCRALWPRVCQVVPAGLGPLPIPRSTFPAVVLAAGRWHTGRPAEPPQPRL